jgi:transposase-like protein
VTTELKSKIPEFDTRSGRFENPPILFGKKIAGNCPHCNRKRFKKLIGGFVCKSALNSVLPKEAVHLAKNVLACTYCGFSAVKIFCPNCESWELENIYSANGEWGFECRKCGFYFAIID